MALLLSAVTLRVVISSRLIGPCAREAVRSRLRPIRSVVMDESPNDRSLEEHRFTRTRDGWRFTAPMVWPLGGRVYLVNETRKAER